MHTQGNAKWPCRVHWQWTWRRRSFFDGSKNLKKQIFGVRRKVSLKLLWLDLGFILLFSSPNIENQPKMNYNLSEKSVKINSTSHFNFNPELKNFVEGYLETCPNLDIIKITDPACMREIEKVLSINDEVHNPSAAKRERIQKQTFAVGHSNRIVPRIAKPQTPSSSRLLNALSGQRLGNVTVNRVSSINIKRENHKSWNKFWGNFKFSKCILNLI